jgi:hypothetical protein
MNTASSLKLFSVLGTVLLVQVLTLVVVSSYKPPKAPLQPSLTVLTPSARVDTQSHVS